MCKYILMFTFCLATQRAYSASLFEYNINSAYDLVAEEPIKYSNFWSSSDFIAAPQTRYKHYARGRGHGKGKTRPSAHAFDFSDDYNYSDLYQGYSDEIYDLAHNFHPHGQPPGQAKKHGHYTHVIPPRFPPPPVYQKDFMNPWKFVVTTPFFVQQSPFTTPRPFVARQSSPIPKATTEKKLPRTTAAPTSSTPTDDELTYDIDVRFGRE